MRSLMHICRFLTLSVFCLCTFFTVAHAEVKDMSAAEALVMIEEAAPDTVILDVRMPKEFDMGHAEGAILIDFYDDNFANDVAQLDKNKTYVVYCRTGIRAGKACAIMEEQGFGNVYNVAGGYHAMFPDKTYELPQ